MSDWLSDLTSDESQKIDEDQFRVNQQKAIPKNEPTFFQGTPKALFTGAGAGFAKAADTITAPITEVIDRTSHSFRDVRTEGFIEPYSEYKKSKDQARDELTMQAIDYLEDKENTGVAGRFVFGLTDYGTRAIVGSLGGGIVGATAVTGASEYDFVKKDLVRKGVDESTATKVAATQGVVAGVSTALPLAYGFRGTSGLIADGIASIGGATAISTGGQYASNQMLESGGYVDQAKQYEVTKESIALDLALNSLFFVGGRYASRLDSQVDAELADIEANTTAKEAVLVFNELDADAISSPVKSNNPIQINNHLKNLSDAKAQLKSGRPVNIANTVKGEDRKTEAAVDIQTLNIPDNAKTIAREAQKVGVDPSAAVIISHIETGGRFNPDAKNQTSSAHGVFQVLDGYWNKVGGGDRNNLNNQIRVGLQHIKETNSQIEKSIGRSLEPHEQYLGHLLGGRGASRILKADPNAKLIEVVRQYDKKNANAIVNNNGMNGLTVGQAINKWKGKWNSLSARYGGGGTSTVMGLDGSSYETAFEVKSFGDLIASNDLAYGVNSLYPSELQPRDRTREASRQQIESMANDLRPEWLGESVKLSDGAPIVGMDNVVESGNGRTLAIGKAYESGKADAYKKFVADFAASRGIDISGIDRPVLVRTRLTDTDRVQFTRLANQADVAQFSATERAKTDADRLPDTSLIKLNADGAFNLDQSMDFVRGFVGQLPKSEQSAVITGDGRLSQDGKRRIESAIAQRAYKDSSLITRLSENLDDDSKSVLNALLRVAPQLAQLNDLVKQGGRHRNTLSEDLTQAAQKLSDLKANGQTVSDYLNQGQLIEDGLSDGAKAFLNVFDSNKRSAKAIGESIQSEIDRIEGMGDPRQGSLFGSTPEEQIALDIANQNPDQVISIQRENPNGEIEEITITMGELIQRIDADNQKAKSDIIATEAAINCAIRFGEA